MLCYGVGMRRLCILALPEVFDSAFAITRDVLEAGSRSQAPGAGDGGAPHDPFTVETVTVGGRGVPTAGGLAVPPGRGLTAAVDADLVLVPGFSLGEDGGTPRDGGGGAVGEYLRRSEVRTAVRWLRSYRAAGGRLAAGCTATFVLAEAGLLDGLQATTSWWLADAFRSRYPAVDLQAHMMVTHQGGILCAGAALAHTDLALRVVGDLRGPAVADYVARRLLLDERVSQGHYMARDHLSRRHPDVSKAEAWIRAHLGEPMRVDDVAAAVAVSPRTLARRLRDSTGESPLSFIQRLRVQHAVHLLETSKLSFEEIAARVGYQEPAGLRRVLRRRTGRAPSSFRDRLRSGSGSKAS
ncbi:MAG: helix-turn-helix domain-containing protein [Acidobacteriota bacterium]